MTGRWGSVATVCVLLTVDEKVIVITGAAGFLGSALAVDLACGHRVVAIDRRKPTDALLAAARGTQWHRVDIGERGAVARALRCARRSFGRLDFVVHLAAFYDFGTDWKSEYERTNLQGTLHVLRSACESGARRVIFASSIAAMEPAPRGETLTEQTPTSEYTAYAKSKSVGEKMVREATGHLPGVVLRIAGAFSDWCELPPLCSLIGLWAGRSPLRRLLVGQGTTGMPYIHRHDVVGIVRACLDAHETLGPYEVLLASQQGAVLHKDLFAATGRADPGRAAPAPILVSRRTASLGLGLRRAIGALTGRVPFERPWMLKYVDRPWLVDATYTREKLGWRCAEGMGILDRLPAILAHFRQDRRTWEERNSLRNQGRYAYYD